MESEGEPTTSAPIATATIRSLTTSGVRNLASGTVAIGTGVTLVWGANGAGKSSLLEALCLALAGHSPRTPRQREAIGFGDELARAEAMVDVNGRQHVFLWSAARSGERRHLLGGNPAGREASYARPPLMAFVPDRLGLVKGGPGPRRAHLDRLCEAVWPARAGIRDRYRHALAQRNALLVSRRGDEAPALDAWDRELAETGVELITARAAAVERLRPHVAAAGADLGLEGIAVAYRPRSDAESADALVAELRARRQSDIARGFSGHGPHLDEVEVSCGGRAVRRYGSQGEQRAALLALLLAERTLLLEARETPALMLLDDVMSELDPGRRELLTARLTEGAGQAIVTATEPTHLPASAGRLEIALDAGRVLPRLARSEAA
jgi:DNA replication and repair protein RecF